MKQITLISALILLSLTAISQNTAATWNITQSRSEDGSHNLHITANIHPDWYIYGMNIEEGGPLPLHFSFENQNEVVSSAVFTEKTTATTAYDEVFEMNVSSYSNNPEFRCNYVPRPDKTSVTLIIDGQACNKINGSCIQVYQMISLTIQN